MKRTPVPGLPENIPAHFLTFLEDAALYDSSCSQAARVCFIDKGPGYFLKTAPGGKLREEVEMTRYFHSKGLGAEVVDYESSDQDWLLTVRIPGEDCIHRMYLDNPVRLCDTMAEILRELHSVNPGDCPVDRTGERIEAAAENCRRGRYDASLFPGNWGFCSPEEAGAAMLAGAPQLKSDVLIHGDCCLPNILLDNWRFSGFIDVGAGGRGDRHFDLFWCRWSLGFNLKTGRYADRFLDAYGRDAVEPELLRTVAALEVFG